MYSMEKDMTRIRAEINKYLNSKYSSKKSIDIKDNLFPKKYLI